MTNGGAADSVLSFALAQVVAEMAIKLKLDPDGSVTMDRLLGAIGGFEQVSTSVGTDAPAPWAAETHAARTEARLKLKRAAPLLSRLAQAAQLED